MLVHEGVAACVLESVVGLTSRSLILIFKVVCTVMDVSVVRARVVDSNSLATVFGLACGVLLLLLAALVILTILLLAAADLRLLRHDFTYYPLAVVGLLS